MAGIAVLVGSDMAPQAFEQEFIDLLRLTARHKQLEIPSTIVRGMHCLAAKLDSPASIHPGMVRDDQTGSWLMAAGTVVALVGDNEPTTVLQRLLSDYVDRGAKRWMRTTVILRWLSTMAERIDCRWSPTPLACLGSSTGSAGTGCLFRVPLSPLPP